MWFKIYIDAVLLATDAHHTQMRRNVNEPYIMHPLRVSKLIYDITGDLRLAAAGVCHDTLEDTRITEEELAGRLHPEIARLVKTVTKRKDVPKAESEREFLNRYRSANIDTVILKLADRFDNVNDLRSQNNNFKERYRANTIDLIAATPNFSDNPIVAKLISMIQANI